MATDPTGEEWRTPVKITSTSATERAGFRKCRRQWFLGTVHRLDSNEGNVHFFLGNIYHSGLEAYYKAQKAGADPDDCGVAALDAYQDAYTDAIDVVTAQLGFLASIGVPAFKEAGELGFEMLQNYIDREKLDPLFDEVVAVEFRVNVAIRNPKGRRVGILSVQADVVGRKDGELKVADHKTASRVMPSSHLDLDDQLTAEVFAWWQASGEFPERAVYNVSYKKRVGPPEILKKPDKQGRPKLSKSKSQATTAELYRQAIIEHHLDPAEYADILATLEERERNGEDTLFRREEVFRTPGQMDAFERDLFYEWSDMKRVAAHPEQAYPNPTSMNCGGCPVRAICTTIQDGGDVAAIIQAGYIVADPRR